MRRAGDVTRQLWRALYSLGLLHGLGAVLTLAIGILLARLLGPEGYGIYALSMAILALAGMVTEFGFPVLAIREFSAARARDSWAEARGLVIWADRFILAFSALLYVAVFAGAALIREPGGSSLMQSIYCGLPLVPLVALAKVRGSALLAMGKTARGQAPVLVLRPAVFALLLVGIWFIVPRPSARDVMLLQVSAASVATLAVFGWYRGSIASVHRRDVPVLRPRAWLAASIPMSMSEGLRLIQGQMSLILVGALSTVSAAGLYRVADAASAMCLLPLTIVAVASSPTVSQLHASGDRVALQRSLGLLALAQVVIVLLLALPFFFFGDFLLGLAFGKAFSPAAPLLSVLLGSAILAAMFGPSPAVANMIGLERTVTLATGIAVAAQLGLGLALIPGFGALGASVATGAGQILWSGYIAFRIRQRRQLDTTLFACLHFKRSASPQDLPS